MYPRKMLCSLEGNPDLIARIAAAIYRHGREMLKLEEIPKPETKNPSNQLQERPHGQHGGSGLWKLGAQRTVRAAELGSPNRSPSYNSGND